MEYKRLDQCSVFSTLRTNNVDIETYISTENMLPNRGGICIASSIPDCKTASKYEPQDILISNIRPYFKKIWYANREGSCSNDVLVIKANETIDSKFLYYVLSDDNFFNYDTVTSKGTKMPRGSKSAIMKYFVPDIPLTLQRRIASILSSYDDMIELNTRRIKLLEQMAENLYKEWFVRFRFPNYQSTPIENGIPKGWKVETIDSFCRVFTGKKDVNQTVEDGQYPFFSCSAQDFRSNDYIYDGKAILVAGNGNTGKSKFYDGKFDLYQRTYAIVCDTNSDLIYYLYMRFKTDFELVYAGGSRGTAIPYIVMKNITKYKFLYHKELIDKYIAIVKPMISEIAALQSHSANLTRQRDLLLPRLMSGQLTPQ